MSRQKTIGPGQTSRQANLAVTYLDAFAPAIIEALSPKSWPRVVVIDSTTLMTRGFRKGEAEGDDDGEEAKRAGNLKAGTIMVALDATARATKPVLIQVQGGKDVESWKAFFATLDGTPDWVIADLDWAIARAVRETWPKAILYHSRHHLAELMRKRAFEDGIEERVRLDEPIALKRPLPWSPSQSKVKRWGEHPLLTAIALAQRGPDDWAALKAAVEAFIKPDKLALRSWIATNELLIERQWRMASAHRGLPHSTGSVEGKLGEWLAPIERRAGRWQNARRLNLALGLMTLRAREEAHEARYARIVRALFEARENASHLPAENTLPEEEHAGKRRQMSWWRTWQDRSQPSLPRLVFESNWRTKQRETDDHAERVRERLNARYAAENDLRKILDLVVPPTGRPKRTSTRQRESVKGKVAADFDDLMLEWDWDLNGDLDPATPAAGGRARVAWSCLLNSNHVWETRIADRTYNPAGCPYHMGNKVHPSESLAAFYPWLALEWHPTKNSLRPDQVTRASAQEINWICEHGHEWPAPVYPRTLSKSGFPECQKLEASARIKAGQTRGKQAEHARIEHQIVSIVPIAELEEDIGF